MSAGFYKSVIGQGILYAPSFVHAPGYSLFADEIASYTFPVDGWYWFDSQTAAESSFITSIAPPTTAITKLAFRQRFFAFERVTMEIAQLDNPNASMQARQLAAALRSSNADLAASKYVDLGRADTQRGVQALESSQIIGVGRAAEILDAPIQISERP